MTRSGDTTQCPVCGTAKSGWLADNCPTCLMGLGEGRAEALPAPELESPHDPTPTRHVGDYELVQEIARGGMGVVYRARQVSLNRTVAVKLLLGGHFANDTFARRFRHEAQAAASLNHPNIVSIHEIGEHDGQPYFSMALIEGRSLAEMARASPLPAAQAARLVRTVAEAVQFAHDCGVLHRDLKPSNVMVDALGVPHITDFGLAKRAQDEAEITLTGQVLGTPNYMPPEQVEPKRGLASAASDVYSIGAILYQLLTGRAPFMAETLAQTLRLVLESEPVSPRLLNPGVPQDLETICCKCLEKEPQRRYATAQELADELGRFLSNEPIRARRIGPAAKLVRWRRRKPALAASLIITITLLLVVAIGSPIAMFRIDRERRLAEAARRRAEHADRQTQQQLYTALLGQAHASVQSREVGQRVRALDAIRRAAAISNSAELRREAIAALALPDLRFEQELPMSPDVTLVSIDPEFSRMAVGRGRGPVEIRDLRHDHLLATLANSANLHAHVATWSADGQFIAVKRDYDSAGARADVEVWDVTNALRALLLRDVSWGSISFHPTRHQILVGAADAGARVFDVDDGSELNHFPLAARPVCLQLSPDGTRFAALCYSASRAYEAVSVHDAATGETLWADRWTNTSTRQVTTLSWHPSGRWLAVPDTSGAVTLIDAVTGGMRTLGEHKAQAVKAGFTPEGRYLFTAGWERELICWDLHTMQRAFTIGPNADAMQIRADGRECAIRTKTTLQLHALEMPLQREFEERLGTHLRRAAFSPDGRWLAASGENGGALWDLVRGGPGAFLEEASGESFCFTADGRELFGSSCSRWQVAPATNFAAPPRLKRLAFRDLDDSTQVCLSSNFVVLTSLKGSQVVKQNEIESATDRWMPTSYGVSSASSDGRWLGIFRAFGSSLNIYRLPGLEHVAKLTHPAGISSFEFSPRTGEVAIYSSRAGVEFWSTATWQRTRALTNFIKVMFTTEGRGWWLTQDSRNAGLYDPDTLHELLPLPSGASPLSLSGDGRYLAVSVDARRLQLWDVTEVQKQLRDLGLGW